MEHRRDPLDPTYQPQPEAAPSGAPQFNQSNCGYRCGWGCCEPREGDSDSDEGGDEARSQSDGGTTTTLIGDEEQNEQIARAPVQMNFVVRGTPRPEGLPVLGEIQRGTGLVILSNGSMVPRRNGSAAHSPRLRYHDDLGNSMMPEPSSGYVSGYMSTRHSVSGRSWGVPSPMSPGLRYSWVDEEHFRHLLPPEYYFLEPPLRLSPPEDLSLAQDVGNFLNDFQRFQMGRSNLGMLPFDME